MCQRLVHGLGLLLQVHKFCYEFLTFSYNKGNTACWDFHFPVSMGYYQSILAEYANSTGRIIILLTPYIPQGSTLMQTTIACSPFLPHTCRRLPHCPNTTLNHKLLHNHQVQSVVLVSIQLISTTCKSLFVIFFRQQFRISQILTYAIRKHKYVTHLQKYMTLLRETFVNE